MSHFKIAIFFCVCIHTLLANVSDVTESVRRQRCLNSHFGFAWNTNIHVAYADSCLNGCARLVLVRFSQRKIWLRTDCATKRSVFVLHGISFQRSMECCFVEWYISNCLFFVLFQLLLNEMRDRRIACSETRVGKWASVESVFSSCFCRVSVMCDTNVF